MDTFAALALATDPARPILLERQPDKRDAPLISVEMIKMILVQALYQIVVCLVLHFVGLSILGLAHTPGNDADLRTLVFNCFVFCQICKSNSHDPQTLSRRSTQSHPRNFEIMLVDVSRR